MTGLLISQKLSYQILPLEHLTRSTFHTLPIKLYIVVIEIDALLPFSAAFQKMAHHSLSLTTSTS